MPLSERAFLAKYLTGAATWHAGAKSFPVSMQMLRACKQHLGALPAPDIAIPLDHLTPTQAREIAAQLTALDQETAA